MSAVQKFDQSTKKNFIGFLPMDANPSSEWGKRERDAVILAAWQNVMGCASNGVVHVDEGHVFHGHTQRDVRVATSFILYAGNDLGLWVKLGEMAEGDEDEMSRVLADVAKHVVPEFYVTDAQDTQVLKTTVRWLGSTQGREFVSGVETKLNDMAESLTGRKSVSQGRDRSVRGLTINL